MREERILFCQTCLVDHTVELLVDGEPIKVPATWKEGKWRAPAGYVINLSLLPMTSPEETRR
jgi:hypothetical protein